MSPVESFRDLLAFAASRCVPLEASIELTRTCNCRCVHCYLPRKRAPDRLSTERVCRLLDELADIGSLFLSLTGGEPLLRDDLFPIIRHARRAGLAARLLTNASLIDAAAAAQLGELGVVAQVSLFSLDARISQRITGRGDALARTQRGLELLLARQVRVVLVVPLLTLNAGEVEGLRAFALRLGVECRVSGRLVPRRDGDLAPLAFRLPRAAAAQLERGQSEPPACPPAPAGPRGVTMCAAGRRCVHVTAAGEVLACNLLPQPAGNVLEQPLAEIWERSPWLRQLRSLDQEHLRGCSRCSALERCGRCPGQALLEDGDLLGPSSWACAGAQ